MRRPLRLIVLLAVVLAVGVLAVIAVNHGIRNDQARLRQKLKRPDAPELGRVGPQEPAQHRDPLQERRRVLKTHLDRLIETKRELQSRDRLGPIWWDSVFDNPQWKEATSLTNRDLL